MEATLFDGRRIAERVKSLKTNYIDKSFHHYLPQSKEQQTFKFYEGDENEFSEYVAEMQSELAPEPASDSVPLKERIEKQSKHLSINIEELLRKMDLEKEEKEQEELDKLGKEYQKRIEFHNTGKVVEEEEM